MFGRGLIVKAATIAVMSACVFVGIAFAGVTLYATLAIWLLPAGAAALTALAFAVGAGIAAMILKGPGDPDEDDEPAGIQDRVVGLFRTRPIMGTVAGLAAGYIFLRNPALATMVAAAFTEKAHGSRSRR